MTMLLSDTGEIQHNKKQYTVTRATSFRIATSLHHPDVIKMR
jgi:hypothetical protein